MKSAGNFIAGFVAAAEFCADAFQKRINGNEEFLGREATERAIPHPFVAHGANGAGRLGRVGDATENRRDHVAMFEGGDELGALFGIVAQPVEKFGETPFGGIRAAAPVDDFELSHGRLR